MHSNKEWIAYRIMISITPNPDGTHTLLYEDKKYTFPTKDAALVGLHLHEQAKAAGKKQDGVSPAAAATDGAK